MAEKRVTKKAIVASLLSVAVCTTMLVGTSYAWFTDTASSNNNRIKSGTLSIDLLVKKDNRYQSVKNQSEPIFNYNYWEPGYTAWENVKVTTEGDLALKYTLRFVSDEDIASAKLAEAIDVYYAPTEIQKPTTRPASLEAHGLRKLGTLAEVFGGGAQYQINDTLIPAAAVANGQGATADVSDEATIVFKMQETAGNEYQNQTIPAFDMQVIAMQYNYETDTFDKDYDEKANGIPDHPEWGNLNTSASAKTKSGEATVINATGATLTIPADTFAADTDVTFTVAPTALPAGFVVADNVYATTYDISVDPASDEVIKTVELNVGKGKSGVVIYHNTTAMTKLNSADEAAEGYFYNPVTGILTIKSKTFSPFTIVEDKGTVVAPADAATAIAAAQSGDTVVLGAGKVELPATLPENVLIKGSSAGETHVDASALQNSTKNNPVKVNISDVTFDKIPSGTYSNRLLKFAGEGTFTNCKFKSDTTNALYQEEMTGDTTFENCEFSARTYCVNYSNTMGTLLFKNCDFTGWNSWGDGGKVVLDGCTFHKDVYGVICAWSDIEINNCTLDEDIQIYAHKVPKVWKINNTTKNGVKITADNIKTMFDITDKDVTDIWNLCELYVDGVRVPADSES